MATATVEGVERIVACYAAVRAETAEAVLATCGKGDSHDLGSERQASCQRDPYPKGSYLEAYRCSVDGGAFDPAAGECVAAQWAKAPCCSVAWTVGGRFARS